MNTNEINKINTLKELNEYSKKINEAIEKRSEYITLCNKASLIGEKDFYYLKEAFESMSPKLFNSSDGKKILNRYTRLVKENKNLNSLHLICENIRKATNGIDVDYFVNTLTNTEWGLNTKTLEEDTKKLGKIISEAYLFIGKDADSILPLENKEMSNAIKFISENKKTNKNITDFSKAIKVIKESINKIEEVKNDVSLDKLSEDLIKEFNEKYVGQLSDYEASIIKEFANNSDKKTIFEKCKKDCLDKLNEKKELSKKNNNNEEFEQLSSINEQVNKKTFSEEKFSEDICSLIKMISVLA